MFTRIIWATDGSEAADLALPYAKELAAAPAGKLFVVHCKEILTGRAGGVPVLADEAEVEEKIRAQVSALEGDGIDTTLRIDTATSSHAAHLIAEIARELAADAIVVGTRGHAPVAGLLLGSVTQRLLHIAPCPVIAVPATRATKALRDAGEHAVHA